MRRQLIALRLLLSALSVSLLVPSANLSWAQNQPPSQQISAPIFDTSVLHLAVSEAEMHPRSFSVKLPTILETNRSQTRARFFIAPPSYHQLLIDNTATLNLRQITGTAESRRGGNSFIRGTPNKSVTFGAGFLKLSNQTINRASALNYHDRVIPFAGPITLRVAKQLKAHPRITSVLTKVHPEF